MKIENGSDLRIGNIVSEMRSRECSHRAAEHCASKAMEQTVYRARAAVH